jgi:hypothetical protein
VLKLLKEPIFAFDKRTRTKLSKQLTIAEIYASQSEAGNAVASFNLALILFRFGYEQWSNLMKTSALQGSTLGASYACAADVRTFKNPFQGEEKFNFCKKAFLGGAPQADVYLGLNIRDDEALSPLGKIQKIKSINDESNGFFQKTDSALIALGTSYFELGNYDEAIKPLYNVSLRGDIDSRFYVGKIFSDSKSKYYNQKAGNIWTSAYIIGAEKAGKNLKNGVLFPSSNILAKSIALDCDANPTACNDGIDQSFKKSSLELSTPPGYIPSKMVLQGKIKESDYPSVARKNNITGQTYHMFRVNENGLADECYTLKSNLVYSTDVIACKRIAEGVWLSPTFKDKPLPEFKYQSIRWSLRETKQNSSPALGVLFLLLGIVLR